MKTFILLASAALLLTACDNINLSINLSPTQGGGNTPKLSADIIAENKRLDDWLEEKFQSEVALYPEYLAALGIKERTTEWNDPSREFAAAQIETAKATLDELRLKFDTDKMDADHKLSYRLFERDIQNTLAADEWYYHGYPFNQMGGRQSRMPTFMLNYHQISDEQDARDYITRLEGIKANMDTYVEHAKASAEKGIMPPTFVFDHVIRDAENVISGAPFEDTKFCWSCLQKFD